MMLTVISPAKKLDYRSPVSATAHTQPALLKHSQELLEGLKKLSPQDVCRLMGLSDKLGALNYERFQEWSAPFNEGNARQASGRKTICAFCQAFTGFFVPSI
jgi:cytoplasmic iron level regulating protein YaaA (DUF328/UPF0246 family)